MCKDDDKDFDVSTETSEQTANLDADIQHFELHVACKTRQIVQLQAQILSNRILILFKQRKMCTL